MNPVNRKLLASVVAQHIELGETEWFFNPLAFLKEEERGRTLDIFSRPGDGRSAPARKNIEKTIPCDLPCRDEGEMAGKNSLQELHETMRECLRCPLGEKRKNFVFGSGNPEADIMFVGEAPGADEDQQGLPFVGRAGQLLTKMIESIKLSRGEVFISNILKCRPPGNRDPLPSEIEKCEPILLRQIELIRPKIICALGRISGQTLLRTNATLGALRGKVHDYHGIKLIVTYHPAALLRNPQWKRPTWEDLKFLRREYDGVEL
jgi:DNA polymerase